MDAGTLLIESSTPIDSTITDGLSFQGGTLDVSGTNSRLWQSAAQWLTRRGHSRSERAQVSVPGLATDVGARYGPECDRLWQSARPFLAHRFSGVGTTIGATAGAKSSWIAP